MLTPHAVDIAVTISSLIASHLPNHSTTFSLRLVVHWSADIQTTVYDPRIDRPTDRPNDQASEFVLTR